MIWYLLLLQISILDRAFLVYDATRNVQRIILFFDWIKYFADWNSTYLFAEFGSDQYSGLLSGYRTYTAS
jgi:hypothetical protein